MVPAPRVSRGPVRLDTANVNATNTHARLTQSKVVSESSVNCAAAWCESGLKRLPASAAGEACRVQADLNAEARHGYRSVTVAQRRVARAPARPGQSWAHPRGEEGDADEVIGTRQVVVVS